jgi:hypothetical protein
MASVPTNPRLYNLVVVQAKAKFAKYPSPAASHWVHQRYMEEGGKFLDKTQENRRKEILAQQFAAQKQALAKKNNKKHEGKKHEEKKD